MRSKSAVWLAAGAWCVFAASARAEITSITITSTQPAFGGASFGSVGTYVKITGTAYGEVDASDPTIAQITDIALAPRGADGKVAYSTSFVIIKPADPSKGNHELLYEANNRGNKLMIGTLDVFSSATNTITSANNPTTAGDAGNGWLMRQGYTLAWSGWDPLVANVNSNLTMTAPVATNANGTAIIGPSLEELEVDNSTTTVLPLSYPAANPSDASTGQLTVREHYADAPVPVTGWTYASPTAIKLAGGAAFTQGRLYEFAYQATNPIVEGLGFASVRDFVDFLRHGSPTTTSAQSPLGNDIAYAVSFSISQPGRFMRDFVKLGFNAGPNSRKVFDGVDNYIAAGSGIFLNYRFAEPFRTERQHIARWYPEATFPFAWQTSHDPITGMTAGRLQTCETTGTCPKIIESYSENEFWSKAGSLTTTDPTGRRDLPQTPYVRFYQFASEPHAAASGLGICAQTQNPLLANAGLRALLVDLDAWIRNRGAPPEDQVPRLDRGELVSSLPQRGVRFPTIPTVTYNGVKTIRDTYDFGAAIGQGIITIDPPRLVEGETPTATDGAGIYPSYVPLDDEDGNNVAGIRMPDVEVPVGTFTGWALQGPAYASGDGCDASGQFLPFPFTRAAAKAAKDPRRSLAERYPTHVAYVRRIKAAARRLEAQRLLLPEDVASYIAAAQSGTTGGTSPTTSPLPIAH